MVLANPQPVLVSVILPLYNAQFYVLNAVKSVLQETRIPLELILVDDGSTDRSLEILNTIRDDRLIVLRNQGKGIASALNTGLAAARGKFIARCDADDCYMAGRLFKQVKWLMQHPRVGAVCGSYCVIDSKGFPVTEFDWSQKIEEITGELQAGTTRTHLCTFVMRTAIVRSIGGFRPYFITGEDIDFQLRLGEATSVWYLPEICYHYRLHPISITHTKSSTEREFFDQIARELQRQRQQQGFDALQQGYPPIPPQSLNKPPLSAKQHLQSLLLGEAWRSYQTGRSTQAMLAGMRSALAVPTNLGVWRSVLSLFLKSAGANSQRMFRLNSRS